jgi:predicted nucleic acid-binding protein
LRLVVADTGPINYLILIEHIDLLRALFGRVILPFAVAGELIALRSPSAVRYWACNPPAWVGLHATPGGFDADPLLKGIDAGEKAAIALASTVNADLLLMDDRRGVKAARRIGLRVTGTLGVLELAAQSGLVDFAQAVDRLRRTNFRVPEVLIDALLDKLRKGSSR